jgi:hypothetical protein
MRLLEEFRKISETSQKAESSTPAPQNGTGPREGFEKLYSLLTGKKTGEQPAAKSHPPAQKPG